MDPKEIREIRMRLGLSQAEAGKYVGGGPSAFAKYESGHVEPSAALVRLLQVAKTNPEVLGLSVRQPPRRPFHTGPFEVSEEQIHALTEYELSLLIRRLLQSEADENDLPFCRIHVPSEFRSADDGEDGRIQWDGGPERTKFLPGRYVQFQLKSGPIYPKQAEAEVVKNGEVKNLILAAIREGAHYVLLCTKGYNQKQIGQRVHAIVDALTKTGLEVDKNRVHFWDAELVCRWVNHHPVVANWLLELVGAGSVLPFHSLDFWSAHSHHDIGFVEDERLSSLRDRIVRCITEPRQTMRILGAKGVGKSRLVLEAFRSLNCSIDWLADFVLYVDCQRSSTTSIHATVDALIAKRKRAILVIDDCPNEVYQVLSDAIVNSSSKLTLLAIDNSDEATVERYRPDVYCLDVAPISVTDEILEQATGQIASEDKRRLSHFSQGYPAIAKIVVDAWSLSTPIAHATENSFVDKFVCGRVTDPELIRTAQLIAVFGLVRDEMDGKELIEVANSGELEIQRFRSCIETLIDRRVIQKRGNTLLLQPRPIAMNLAARQWRQWSRERWTTVLFKLNSQELRTNAARQLAWLNTTEIAERIVKHVCGPQGPLVDPTVLCDPVHMQVMSRLVEVDAMAGVGRLRQMCDEVGDLGKLERQTRRPLVIALQKIAFRENTFHSGASLLLRLAVTETEPSINNNATGQFAALFRPFGGETAANGNSRLAFLAEYSSKYDKETHRVVVRGLLAGARAYPVARLVGSESHGSRHALQTWHPSSNEEMASYLQECANQLVVLAQSDSELEALVRESLAGHFRDMLRYGLMDCVEQVAESLSKPSNPWIEAIEELGNFLKYDSLHTPSENRTRVARLIEKLEPTELIDRVRYLVINMPWDYPCGEDLGFRARAERQRQAIKDLASDICQQPDCFRILLPELSVHQQRRSFHLGYWIAQLAESPLTWLEHISLIDSYTTADNRSFDLLAGFVVGLAEVDRAQVEKIKLELSRSTVLAPSLPTICRYIGVEHDDVALVLKAVESDVLKPKHLLDWGSSDCLARVDSEVVAQFLDRLLVGDRESFNVAVDVLAMLCYSEGSKLESFRVQILRIAELAFLGGDEITLLASVPNDISKLVGWLLKQGRLDRDARRLALMLAQSIASLNSGTRMKLISPLVPLLLSEFAEIVWPLIGQAVLSEARNAWTVRELLRGPKLFMDEKEDPPLLSLPRETLIAWCKANLDSAPAIVAGIVPILDSIDEPSNTQSLHPIYRMLLEEFGDCKGVLKSASQHLYYGFGWCGSLADHYECFMPAIRSLETHPNSNIAQWAQNTVYTLQLEIDHARSQEDEEKARYEV